MVRRAKRSKSEVVAPEEEEEEESGFELGFPEEKQVFPNCEIITLSHWKRSL
jgi:hypothetical protein